MMPQSTLVRLAAGVLLLLANPLLAAAPASEPGWARSPDVVIAELALQRGQCREGAEAYTKAALASADASLASRAAQVAVGCEQLDTAWRAVQRWQALVPRNGEAALLATLVALKRYQLEDARKALTVWYDSSSAGNQDPQRFAELLEGESEATAVQRVFAPVFLNDDSNADVVLAAANIAFHSYDFQRALQLAERVIKLEPQQSKAKLLSIRIRSLLGEHDAALASARELLPSLSGEDAFLVADLLANADRGEQARTELLRLREDAKLAAGADRRLGAQALEQGDDVEAEKRFMGLMSQRGSTALATLALAQIAERRGDSERALRAYQMLDEAGIGLQARAGAARVILKAGKRSEALALLEDYARRNPDAAIEAVNTRANLLAGEGDFATALADINAALQRYPAHPSLGFQRANLLERAGRLREAEAALDQLLRARPDDPGLANALGFTLADHNRSLDRAEKLIRQALAISPDNPAIQDSLGWLHYRRGKLAEAQPVLETAWRNGRDAEIGAHLGEVLWRRGEEGRARYVWAQALNHDPGNAVVIATQDRLTGAAPAKRGR
ncbi:MAG: tetratricopeptide repeat protein [Proteobacteria bacterium]|nr:tetratricopeptide repeat protein [Pseudomonadota bacterium]